MRNKYDLENIKVIFVGEQISGKDLHALAACFGKEEAKCIMRVYGMSKTREIPAHVLCPDEITESSHPNVLLNPKTWSVKRCANVDTFGYRQRTPWSLCRVAATDTVASCYFWILVRLVTVGCFSSYCSVNVTIGIPSSSFTVRCPVYDTD